MNCLVTSNAYKIRRDNCYRDKRSNDRKRPRASCREIKYRSEAEHIQQLKYVHVECGVIAKRRRNIIERVDPRLLDVPKITIKNGTVVHGVSANEKQALIAIERVCDIKQAGQGY